MNTQFNSNVIWLQLEYKISTLGPDGASEIKITEKKIMVSDALEDPSPLGQAWL